MYNSTKKQHVNATVQINNKSAQQCKKTTICTTVQINNKSTTVQKNNKDVQQKK